MQLDSILILAAAGATFVKYLIDGLTVAWPLRPPWVPIVMAFVLGIVIVGVLEIAMGVILTQQVMAQCVLAGLAAGATAAGLTASSNTAQNVRSDAKTVEATKSP